MKVLETYLLVDARAFNRITHKIVYLDLLATLFDDENAEGFKFNSVVVVYI